MNTNEHQTRQELHRGRNEKRREHREEIADASPLDRSRRARLPVGSRGGFPNVRSFAPSAANAHPHYPSRNLKLETQNSFSALCVAPVRLGPLCALCNSSLPSPSPFRVEQTDFLQLSPMGVFPHSKGFQQVDRPALERLIKNFNSFFARLGRRFAGVPLYVGHPDVPGLETMHPDRKAYGWIMELELREDGLYGRPKWSAAGRDLIANGHFKFLSPYWKAEAAGTFQGRPAFRPTELLSVGLTNEPNLPVLPLSNAAESAPDDAACLGASVHLGGTSSCESLTGIHHGGAETAEEPDMRNATSELEGRAPARPSSNFEFRSPPHSTLSSSPSAASAASAPLRPLCNSSSADTSYLEERLTRCQEEIALLNERLVNTLLDQAVADARIFPAEREQWQAALADNFAEASARLANAKAKLNLSSRIDQLPRRAGVPCAFEDKQRRMLALVNEKMRATGLGYHEAWVQARAEQPEMF